MMWRDSQLSVERDPSTIDEVEIIWSQEASSIDLNHCGLDKTTALLRAMFGGSVTAVETIKDPPSAGADPNCVDAEWSSTF
ncbi:hypothetical protein HPP92_005832 [Vanilla planifolia]|uniref:Uncharacterized protein n=1 Tax=Vanilla planifolia TaxID=51239 RepID=A0A835RZK7_VANPL|nr:hypothetical protein HPP92_005832 [Vanilla planifolia]